MFASETAVILILMTDYAEETLSWPEGIGPRLGAEITRQLLQDLSHYGVTEPGISFDWSEACIEGHTSTYLDGEIQNYSSIGILDKSGRMIGYGWMDFVHEEESTPLFVYWDLLTIGNARLKKDPGIPKHIWKRLPRSAQALYTRYRMIEEE